MRKSPVYFHSRSIAAILVVALSCSQNPELVQHLQIPAPVTDLRFDLETTMLFASAGNELKIFEPQSGREIRSMQSGSVHSLAYGVDGTIYAALEDSIAAFNARKGERKRVVRSEQVRELTVSPDARTLSAVTETGLRVYDAMTFKPLHFLDRPRLTCAQFSPDGRSIGLCEGGGAAVVDTSTWTVRSLPMRAAAVSLSFSEDGGKIAAALPGEIGMFDTQSGTEIWRISSGRPLQILMSPDGRNVFAATAEEIAWYEAESGRRAGSLSIDGILRMALSKEGRYLAAASRDGSLYVWNLYRSGILHRRFK